MLGKADRQVSFSDYWLKGKISEDSYWNRMRRWALEFLDENIFQPLYSHNGRKSVPPLYTFLAILIQIEKCYSDAEMEEASRFDDRIKYAITAPRDFDGIDAVTLCDHRKRLFCSDVGKKIFIELLKKAKIEGMFDENNLHVIDSFMIWGGFAKQDTYTMIYQGIKMVLKFMSFYKIEKVSLTGQDYEADHKKPKIDWESKDEKKKLLDRLVKDALALVKYINDMDKTEDDLKNAVELLEKVALQDIEFDKNGTANMVDGTAKDRIISVNDPEMRHGRKTSSKRSDGFKAEIITGGEKANLVVSIAVDGANTADGEHMSELIDKAEENGVKIDKLYGDGAYLKMEEIEKREEEGMEFCIHVSKPINANGCYTKEEFEINFDEGKVICPNGERVEFDVDKVREHKGVTVKFDPENCQKCPKKDECTKSKDGGRSIGIHPYEEELQEAREYQKTEEFKEDYSKRSNGERTISQLTRHGGRKARYKGKEKTFWQILMVSINNNMKEIMKYIFSKRKRINLKGELCPKAA
jgi:transposase/IS5 family transposase